jgi:hypothetical protein
MVAARPGPDGTVIVIRGVRVSRPKLYAAMNTMRAAADLLVGYRGVVHHQSFHGQEKDYAATIAAIVSTAQCLHWLAVWAEEELTRMDDTAGETKHETETAHGASHEPASTEAAADQAPPA